MKIIKTTGDDRYSTLELVEAIPETVDASVLGILHEGWRYELYFLPNGTKISLLPVSGHEIKNRPLWVFLANTVYNPTRQLSVRPIESGTFRIDELKTSIVRWLDRDDDILTQFLEADDIKFLLAPVQTFDDLVLAVRCINGDLRRTSLPSGISWPSAFLDSQSKTEANNDVDAYSSTGALSAHGLRKRPCRTFYLENGSARMAPPPNTLVMMFRIRFGELSPELLSQWACDALDAGFDSRSVRMLAASSAGDDRLELERILRVCLEEAEAEACDAADQPEESLGESRERREGSMQPQGLLHRSFVW